METDQPHDSGFEPGSLAETEYNKLNDSKALEAEMQKLGLEISLEGEREREFYFRQPNSGFVEIQNLVTNEEFSRLIYELEHIDTQEDSGVAAYISLAGDLKEFDQSRFEQYTISDSIWIRLVGYLKQYKSSPEVFFKAAAALRMLDQDRFDRDIDLEDFWDKFAGLVQAKKGLWDKYLEYYVLAASLNFTEISNRVPIEQESWFEISRKTSGFISQPLDYAKLKSAIQVVAPPGKSKALFTHNDWERCTTQLREHYSKIDPNKKGKDILMLIPFIKEANEIKYVQTVEMDR